MIIMIISDLLILKNWENNGTDEIGLITPTPFVQFRIVYGDLRSSGVSGRCLKESW